jgi:hypothetical protein
MQGTPPEFCSIGRVLFVAIFRTSFSDAEAARRLFGAGLRLCFSHNRTLWSVEDRRFFWVVEVGEHEGYLFGKDAGKG